MKKFTLPLLLIMAVSYSFAGGLLTNANQSTQYVRTLSRNASTSIDAAYFNPAGLSKLDNGLYFSVHNQSIFQTKTITNDFSLLNRNTFEGNVSAPLFPSGFAVYKTNKLAFSFAFGPNAGGGSATFENGLPSFEIEIAKNLPKLSALSALGYPVEAYDADIHFEGTSIFWGLQLGMTYEVNNMLSMHIGARFVPAKNTYNGYLKNIQFGPEGGLENGQQYLAGAAATATATATLLGQTATTLQPFIDGGAGTLTINQLIGLDKIDAATAAQIQGGLQQLGLSEAQINAMNFAQIQGTYAAASTELSGQAAELNSQSAGLADKTVDVEQTGFGFSPIIGLNITPIENLNIGMKYEFKTKLELTNNTKQDDVDMFPDGEVNNNDIPAIFAIGVDYGITEKFNASVSFNQYFDKGANWDGREKLIEHGMWEASLGLEYKISDLILVSGGFLHGETGVMPEYQTDLSYSNSSNTIGTGLEFSISDMITLNLAGLFSFYKKNQKEYPIEDFPDKITETYTKSTKILSIGVDIKF